MSRESGDPGALTRSWLAAARIHQSYLTGLLLYLLQKKGTETAAEVLFRTFRRQHLDKFLPGLATLGLRDQSDAVACAQFIYLANLAGGVRVEYMPESGRKAWVRYPTPRWIYEDAALCAIPGEIPLAFLRAFHAHCGVSLGNPRLGFVCTMLTTDGMPGLEGYFVEEERDLAPDERLRFAFEESGPDFDPRAAPTLPWEGDRLIKARRNYALQYIRVALPELCSMLGDEGTKLGREAAVLVGMQLYSETAERLGIAEGLGVEALGTEGDDRTSFATYLHAMLGACGDEPELQLSEGEVVVAVPSLAILDDQDSGEEGVFDAWNGLWAGALAAHNRHLQMSVVSRRDRGDDVWRWSIGPRS